MKIFKSTPHIIIVILLTLLTQVGGFIWILIFGFFKFYKLRWNIWKRLTAFLMVYICIIFTIIPIFASFNNRKMLPVFHSTIEPHNLGYVLLCRNYVRTDLYDTIEDIATLQSQSLTGLKLVYLDAGFPFIDGFPLLPHLSHNDGRKVDVSFVYKSEDGNLYQNPSLLGYGVYEEPLVNEINQAEICEDAGYWQYGYASFIGVNTDDSLTLNERQTRLLVEQIQSHNNVQKVFIEPHLINRLKIENIKSKLRFHGCHAVRHDDHIHFQINP